MKLHVKTKEEKRKATDAKFFKFIFFLLKMKASRVFWFSVSSKNPVYTSAGVFTKQSTMKWRFGCCLLLLLASFTESTQDWEAWTTLAGGPSAMQCTVTVIQEALVMGGRNDNGLSTSVYAIDTTNPQRTFEILPGLPIPTAGGFCVRQGLNVFVSNQGSQLSLSTDFNVYMATFGKPQGQYVTSDGWVSLGTGYNNRSRAGIGAADCELNLWFFGGVDESERYLNLIEAYNSTSGQWVKAGYMPYDSRYKSSCDCVTSGHHSVMLVICRECSPSAQDIGLMHILSFNVSAAAFIGPAVMLNFGRNYQSFRTAGLSHYDILVVSLRNESNPRLYYYDMYTQAVNIIYTTNIDMSRARVHASVFPITYRLYLAGGVYLVNGTLSAEVDEVQALPPVEVIPDHGNHTYMVGENVTFRTDCLVGMRVRIATTPSCNVPLEGSPDEKCTILESGNGQVTIPTKTASNGASICVSYGVCPLAGEDRPPCLDETVVDFETCVFAQCCWDSSMKRCFAYVDGPTDRQYYFLANRGPLVLLSPESPNQSSIVRFLTSSTGIAVMVIAGLVLIIGGGGLSWRLLRTTADSSDDDEGSSHPLDQHGKYKILCKLGQGGFGTVYLVSRKSDGERFAMKYIVCKDEEERDYAIKEFEMLHSSQGHPNMIQLIEMFMNWTRDDAFAEQSSSVNTTGRELDSPQKKRKGRIGSGGGSGGSGGKKKSSGESLESQLPLLQVAPRYVCIVMDYCPEGDLCRYILRVNSVGMKVQESMILDIILRQCCSLLSHLHTLKPPIVHRDLKPENILLRSNATECVLTDFGLAQQVEKSYMTTRAGSLHYVAPECWKRHYTTAVDVWALGCIAYGACTGRVTGETARVMFSDARGKHFERDIRMDLRGYSDKLKNIVIGMLQPLPALRLTCQQVLEALDSPDGVQKPRPSPS